MMELLWPPKPKELERATVVGQGERFVGTRPKEARTGSGASRLAMGWVSPVRIAMMVAMASTPPAAPRQWPVRDLVAVREIRRLFTEAHYPDDEREQVALTFYRTQISQAEQRVRDETLAMVAPTEENVRWFSEQEGCDLSVARTILTALHARMNLIDGEGV